MCYKCRVFVTNLNDEAMQLGACNLKPLIKATEDDALKKKYITVLIVKNFLCILFCMIIVTFFSNIFGVNVC